jgi:hypothetical protein
LPWASAPSIGGSPASPKAGPAPVGQREIQSALDFLLGQ